MVSNNLKYQEINNFAFFSLCIHTYIQVLDFFSVSCNPNWSDEFGHDCQDWLDKGWCTSSGFSSGYYYVNDFGQTPLVCPECGCKEGNLTIFAMI